MVIEKAAMGYSEALGVVLEHVGPTGPEMMAIGKCTDRVAAEDLFARVDSPSVNASLKDGYAVRSTDIESASPDRSARLRIVDTAAAGIPANEGVGPGGAIRILTGAKIPKGADTVVAEEFARREGEYIEIANTTEPGRNIFSKGADVALGERMCVQGDRLTPGVLGILAAAGFGDLPVYRRPGVALIATGDEVVAAGRPLPEGKLYASNLTTLHAWCRRYGMKTALEIVSDERETLRSCIEKAVDSSDAVLTSGGAWTGDRDLVAKILDELGWKKSFHRIRIGPGKAVGFGMLRGTPIFLLPGGPPSNFVAFLQIALPGLLKLCGFSDPHLPHIPVTLSWDVSVRDKDWTQFIFGSLHSEDGVVRFFPLELKSRLQSMARATATICVPEGVAILPKGTVVQAQMLS
jgi:molybdopterin molybdotransferase